MWRDKYAESCLSTSSIICKKTSKPRGLGIDVRQKTCSLGWEAASLAGLKAAGTQVCCRCQAGKCRGVGSPCPCAS